MAGRPRKTPLPDENPEAATERVLAPDTKVPVVDLEKEELKRKLAEAEQDKETALAQLEKATQPAPVAPPPPVQAPAYVSPLPRNMRVERSGNVSAQYSTRWPQIRGGTCEFAGNRACRAGLS